MSISMMLSTEENFIASTPKYSIKFHVRPNIFVYVLMFSLYYYCATSGLSNCVYSYRLKYFVRITIVLHVDFLNLYCQWLRYHGRLFAYNFQNSSIFVDNRYKCQQSSSIPFVFLYQIFNLFNVTILFPMSNVNESLTN